MFRNKYIRFILTVVAILLLLILLLSILIRVPTVQNYAQQKVLKSLSEKYNAQWHIDELKISFLDRIEAQGILLKDQASDTLLSADQIAINIGLFTLLNRKIAIDDIRMENAVVNLYELPDGKMNYSFVMSDSDNSTVEDVTPTNTDTNSWSFDINNINLEEVRLKYKTKDLEIGLKQDLLNIDFDEIDLAKQVISLDKLSSENTYTYLAINGSDTNNSSSILPDLGWTVTIEDLDMSHRLIEINDEQTTRIAEFNIGAQHLDYHADSLIVDINQLNGSFNEELVVQKGSALVTIYKEEVDANQVTILTKLDQMMADQISLGLHTKSIDINNLTIDVSYNLLKNLEPYIPDDIKIQKGGGLKGEVKSLHYDPKNIDIKNIDFQYETALVLKGSVFMKADQEGFSNPEEIHVNIDMLKSDIHQLDAILNAYAIPDSLLRYRALTASGIAKGSMQLLMLDNFSIKLDDAVNTTFDGKLRNLNNPDILSYDLQFEQAKFNTAQLPYISIDNIDIPSLGQLNYVGKLSGDRTNIKLIGKLESALGSAEADIVLDTKDGIDNLNYSGDLSLSQFDLGTLLKDESLGKLTLTTTITGSGATLQKVNTNFTGIVKDFQYKGYTYESIMVDAHIEDGNIDGVIEVDDPNARLKYDGTVFLGKQRATSDFTVNIDTINLHSLNLYSDEISLSGAIETHLSLPLSERDKNEIFIRNLHLSNSANHLYEDSIMITAHRNVDSTFVFIDSDILQLHLDGDYHVADLPASINDMVNAYIDTDTIIAHTDITSRNFHLYGELNTLMPFKILFKENQLQSKPINIDVKVDFEQNSLVGQIEVDSFYYDDFFSENLLLSAATSDVYLDVDVVGDMNTYAGTPINKLNLANRISNSMVESKLSALDNNNNRMIEFSAQSRFSPEKIVVAMQDSFYLNNKDWEVLSDNKIEIENSCIEVSNFEIANGNERISVNSNLNNSDELSVLFESFEVEEFADLLLSNGSSASGTINGKIDIRDVCTDPYYIANIAIKDIVYDSTYVGMLGISGDTEPGNSMIQTELSLLGPNNKLFGSAKFNTATSQIDMDIVFDSLQLLLLDPFLEDVIKESEGILSGEIKVTGTTKQPNVLGYAKLQNTVTTIIANNTKYSLDNHIINFDQTSIDIGELDIKDEEGNKAKVTGMIYHKNLQDMNIALKLDTKKFTFLNTTIEENPVFSGKVLLSAQGEITGPPSLLKIDITAKTLEGTDITISPYSAETYLREDFITYGKPQDFEDLTDEYLLQLAQEFPFDVTLLLDITEESKLTLVVDPINGDKVVGYGSGNLKIELDQYGEQEFFGLYTVKDGTYNFSYSTFIFKEFKIKQGGTVSFNGDLLDAEVDIAAVHNVYTTTYELIKDQVNPNESELQNSKSRTNVEVYLTLQGPLSDIDILLDIQVPSSESSSLISSIDRRLMEIREDPNELNSQVFGLLLFNSFLVSQNSSTGLGNLGSNIALSSISELISNQLNNFAQNIVKGVDVSIDVNSYDSDYVNDGAGGNVTEVGLKVSKQLFNDRLSVSATGNVDLEENDQRGHSSVVGDFVLEYKLRADGRYRIRVFSKSDYDRLLNENNTKNGVSLYFKKALGPKRN